MELENIYMLSVGQLRELLAYACAEESVDSWWEDITEDDLERVGFYDELDDDDDYEDEEEEEDPDYLDSDEVCIGGALADPAMEEIAQEISYDIVNGRYALEAVMGLYNDNIIDRIKELADLDEE